MEAHDLSKRRTLTRLEAEIDPASSTKAPVVETKPDALAVIGSLARGLEQWNASPGTSAGGTPPRHPGLTTLAVAAVAVAAIVSWFRAESAHDVAEESAKAQTDFRVAQAEQGGKLAAAQEAADRRSDALAKEIADLRQAQIDALDLFTDAHRASIQLQLAMWRRMAPGEEPPIGVSDRARDEREDRIRRRLEPQ